MRFRMIALTAISMSMSCASELAQRAPAADPTSVGAAEAPYHAPAAWQPDPLLAGVGPVAAKPARRYVCPMHADVHAEAEGVCMRCGAKLVPDGAP